MAPVSGATELTLGVGTAVLAMVSVILPMAAGALAPLVIDDLDISKGAFGLLASGYYIGGALFSQLSARAVGTIGTRNGIIVFLGCQIACLAAMPLAGRSYGVLLFLAILYGVGGAGLMPCTNGIIARFRRHRGLAIGMNQAAIPLGGFLSGAALAPLGDRIGWKGAIAVVAAIGLAALFWTTALLRDGGSSVSPRSTAFRPAMTSRRSIDVRWVAISSFLSAVGVAPTYLYTVLFLSSELGMGKVAAANVYAACGLAGIAARLMWGTKFADPERLPAAFLGMALGLAAVPTLLIIATPRTWWPAVAAIVLVGFCNAWMVLVNGALLSVSDDRLASSTGMVYALFFAGMLVSGPGFGVVVDATSSYRAAWLVSLVALLLLVALVASGRLWRQPATARTTGQ